MKDLPKMVLAALFTGLMIAGALITVPFPGVPMVIANAFPWLAGLVLGPLWAAISTGLYLLLGAFGLPVFAKGAGGLGTLLGATGGFLWGYLLSAILVGFLRDSKGNHLVRNTIAVLVGVVAVYIPGVLWLSMVIHHGLDGLSGSNLIQALYLGTGPAAIPFLFVFGDLVKAVAVIAVAGVLAKLPGISELLKPRD